MKQQNRKNRNKQTNNKKAHTPRKPPTKPYHCCFYKKPTLSPIIFQRNHPNSICGKRVPGASLRPRPSRRVQDRAAVGGAVGGRQLSVGGCVSWPSCTWQAARLHLPGRSVSECPAWRPRPGGRRYPSSRPPGRGQGPRAQRWLLQVWASRSLGLRAPWVRSLSQAWQVIGSGKNGCRGFIPAGWKAGAGRHPDGRRGFVDLLLRGQWVAKAWPGISLWFRSRCCELEGKVISPMCGCALYVIRRSHDAEMSRTWFKREKISPVGLYFSPTSLGSASYSP